MLPSGGLVRKHLDPIHDQAPVVIEQTHDEHGRPLARGEAVLLEEDSGPGWKTRVHRWQLLGHFADHGG